MINVSLEEVQFITHKLAKQMLAFDEPIPEFTTRYPKVLESCLATPFQTFGKKELYPGLVDKASMLFYLMVKNHPFQNGNKRVAVTTLLVFLARNKKWLKVDIETLYRFAIDVAKSDSTDKDKILKYISSFIQVFMVPF